MPRLRIFAATAVTAGLAITGQAAAADTFVDPDTGNDANNCTQATVGGPGTGPCATITAAIPKAAGNGTVRVDRGDTYNETAFLESGVSIAGHDVNASDSGPAIIDGGGGGIAVFVQSGVNAGSVTGLTLRGGGGILANGTGTLTAVTQNVFDSTPAASTNVEIRTAGSTRIADNTFTGDGASNQAAISVSDGTPTITGNDVSGYWLGIAAAGSTTTAATSTPVIRGNTITGTHQWNMQAGAGVFIGTGSLPLIEGNEISAPGSGSSSGISVGGFSAPAFTGATVRRNRVSGHHNGIQIKHTGLPSSSTSDSVTGASGSAYEVGDQAADDPGIGDVSIVNATTWANTLDITTIQNNLTLDSSIVQDPINPFMATCTITFSRGPSTTPGGNGCANFQTSADPQLAADNVHLLPGSPMIDAGNPAAPAAGVLDIDGSARAIDITPGCPPENDVNRRDIGADEVPPTAIPQCPAPFVPPPDPPAKKKKCKKPKKLKKGKCVKKKGKKRRKG